jgi:hypothetical protein
LLNADLYLSSSRCVRPLPRGFTGHVARPRSLHSKYDASERGDGNQPRLRAKGLRENPNQMIFVFQDITNWKKGPEHINGLELFLKDRDHLIEKWETLNPDETKTYFEFELTRKAPNAQRPTLNEEGRGQSHRIAAWLQAPDFLLRERAENGYAV